MITAKPTEHLTGITLEGAYDDFHEIVESIYRITGLEEDYKDPYWSVKNRLLGMCYDIRHAYQGDRNVVLINNGVDDELMKWHEMIMPRQNVHYSVEILFPEAVFVALAVPDMYSFSGKYYGSRGRSIQEKSEHPDIMRVDDHADFVRDKAILGLLFSAVFSALGKVIGDEELERLHDLQNKCWDSGYFDYATQYLDKCNIEYLKTDPEKRSNKLKNIAKRLVKKPEGYRSMLRDLMHWARVNGCSIHELRDPKLKYPEEIVW